MLERHHFWSFKNKDQRRLENDKDKERQEQEGKERTEDLASHTHLDHIGRKGFLGLEHSIPSFFRHTRNSLYARWVRGRTKAPALRPLDPEKSLAEVKTR
jgi:hypothetical protein